MRDSHCSTTFFGLLYCRCLAQQSAYLSLRAGGDRLSAAAADEFSSIVMVPLWMVLATKMRYPSPSQWFGLLSGVLNWIVLPSIVLLFCALPFLKARSVTEGATGRDSVASYHG
jgi:hypothetical protein